MNSFSISQSIIISHVLYVGSGVKINTGNHL